MGYCDLLRSTVLLAAGAASALGAITVISANQADDHRTLFVAAAWWAIAAVAGFVLGRGRRAADAVRELLAGARTTFTLPTDRPNRVALARLWPIVAFAIVAGGTGIVFPGVAAIGCGYALLVALMWRNRDAAVTAIEERDGVRFYVEPGSALEPLTLVRTPGLGRDRDPAGASQPPPPSPA
jgi:hypothetical protein